MRFLLDFELDLDEDVDETIQHYARKKRETSNQRKFIPAMIIILIILVAISLYFII